MVLFVINNEDASSSQHRVGPTGVKNDTAKKYRHAIKKHMRDMEGQRTRLKNNIKISNCLTSQRERRMQYMEDRRHLVDAHTDIPIKTMSANRENKLLKIA